MLWIAVMYVLQYMCILLLVDNNLINIASFLTWMCITSSRLSFSFADECIENIYLIVTNWSCIVSRYISVRKRGITWMWKWAYLPIYIFLWCMLGVCLWQVHVIMDVRFTYPPIIMSAHQPLLHVHPVCSCLLVLGKMLCWNIRCIFQLNASIVIRVKTVVLTRSMNPETGCSKCNCSTSTNIFKYITLKIDWLF